MKRILLLLITLLLSLGLMSCEFNIDSIFDAIGDGIGGITSSSSDDEEYEEEEEDEDEEESSSSSQIVIPQPSAPDRTVYSNEILEDGKWVYGKYQLKAPTFTNFYHGYSSALSMTFDDGYDIGTGTYVTSVFKNYGFRGTMMLGPCFLNESLVEQWNEVFDQGYLDVGCHGYEHINPPELSSDGYEHEIKDAIDYLKENFPSQRVLTFATPFAHINQPYEDYLKQFAISNRLEADGKTVVVGEDYNLYRVKSISVLAASDVLSFNSSIANALKQKGSWTVELLHCVKDGATGRDATKEFFSQHCQYLYNNHKDTWVASFEDVSIYLKQLESAKINYIASDRESMSVTVTHSLDESIYNFPMTIKLQIPATIKTAYAVIDGQEYALDVVKGSGVNSVIVKDIPVNSDEPVKIYFGGNDYFANGCDHNYKSYQTVAPSCATHGYTIYKCAFCNVTYRGDFKANLPHDFSGERKTETPATELENGKDYVLCTNCDAKKIIETQYRNIAEESNTETTDGINQWVYVSSMFDGDDTTSWTNGTTPVEIVHSFREAYVDKAEITFEIIGGQDLTVYIFDGAEWQSIETWNSADEQSGGSKFTKEFDISARIGGVKFVFNSSKGCTKICEIAVNGIVDIVK